MLTSSGTVPILTRRTWIPIWRECTEDAFVSHVPLKAASFVCALQDPHYPMASHNP